MELIKKLDIRQTKVGPRTFGLFLCEYCNSEIEDTLTRGKRNKSCGCFRGRHGESNGENKRLHRIWGGMRSRCNNKNVISFKDYGDKGIKVCEEWNNFTNFMNWAIVNGYKKDLTIDRIDNSKGYYPENCRWVSKSVNSQLKTTVRLPECKREVIRNLYSTGAFTQRELGSLFECHFTTIGDFLRGKTWKQS